MVAKGRRALVVLALSVLGALLFALPASAVTPAGGVSGGDQLATLEARLTGEKEVPGPGDPDGIGRATVKVFKDKVCYALKVKRIAPATEAHIHKGGPGVAGPIVVPLKPPTTGFSSGCAAISPELSTALRKNPKGYYVNVHNKPYPEGAIRGQLHKKR